MPESADDATREVSPPNPHIYPSSQTNTPFQQLKAALWFSIGKIVDEESLRLNTNTTPQFIGALTEMVWAQIGTYLLPALPCPRSRYIC